MYDPEDDSGLEVLPPHRFSLLQTVHALHTAAQARPAVVGPAENQRKGANKMELPRRTRREFCAQACQGVALATLGGSLAGCGGGLTGPSAPSLPTVNGTVASATVTLTVDANSPLAAAGSAALLQTPSGSFLVARTGPDTFTALTSTCTHQNCTITGFESQSFVCPCHGSRFDTSGHVLSGPAVSSLRSYPTRFANGILTISL
jgi:cytochrome b6-f complex iron-sulfur subunit